VVGNNVIFYVVGNLTDFPTVKNFGHFKNQWKFDKIIVTRR